MSNGVFRVFFGRFIDGEQVNVEGDGVVFWGVGGLFTGL